MSELQRSVTAILNDDRLAPQMIAYAASLTSLYGDTPGATAIMGDLGRFGVVAALFCLPPPVTRSVVEAAFGPGIAGRGRVASHLSALRRVGAIESVPGDGRSRPLRPTPWLEAWIVRWVEAMVLPAEPWWPGGGGQPAVTPERAVAYLSQLLASSRAGLNAIGAAPNVERMMTLVGGHLFMLELILACEARYVEAPAAFSRRRFARTYGVSRAHAVDLMAATERLGWVKRIETGRILVSEGFLRDFGLWSAINCALANVTLQGRLLPVLREHREAGPAAGDERARMVI